MQTYFTWHSLKILVKGLLIMIKKKNLYDLINNCGFENPHEEAVIGSPL